MPQPPSGTWWEVELRDGWVQVRLCYSDSSSIEAQKFIKSSSQAPDVAIVELAQGILDRRQLAFDLQDQLGVNVEAR
jgi:hypothetical protein